MKTYHQSRVEPGDIDNLGHMNAASIGLDDAALAVMGARLFLPDAHTRFLREQLEGAPLEVKAGILDAKPGELIVYLELLNRESGVLSASFHHQVKLVGRQDGVPLSIPDDVLSAAQDLRVHWPEHGRPRSLGLDPMRHDTTRDDLESRGIKLRFDGYVLGPDDCTPEGFMDLSEAPWIAFAKPQAPRRKPWVGGRATTPTPPCASSGPCRPGSGSRSS